MNAIYLALGADYYARFADSSPFPFVRDTWRSLVLPNQGLFITILIVFEATAGGLILSGGRRSQIGLIGLIGFHVGQLAFGGVLWPWAIVMLIALVLLLRAERSPSRTRRVRAVNLMTSPPRRPNVWPTVFGILLVTHGLLTIWCVSVINSAFVDQYVDQSAAARRRCRRRSPDAQQHVRVPPA